MDVVPLDQKIGAPFVHEYAIGLGAAGIDPDIVDMVAPQHSSGLPPEGVDPAAIREGEQDVVNMVVFDEIAEKRTFLNGFDSVPRSTRAGERPAAMMRSVSGSSPGRGM